MILSFLKSDVNKQVWASEALPLWNKKLRHIIPVLGTASFFLSPQSANPQPNFNFLNPQ